jgi:hypothetical protein
MSDDLSTTSSSDIHGSAGNEANHGGGGGAPWIGAPVAATRGGYYRNARLLMVALMVGLGGWFIKDGFHSYPKANKDAEEKARTNGETEKFDKDGKFIGKPEHSETDILLQKVLGLGMVPAGLGYLAFFLHRSRGAYRLDGYVISIPGHPPFRISEVQRVDKRLWDRKGIAILDYRNDAGQSGSVTIDDFVYDRTPTDILYYRTLIGFEYGKPDDEYLVQGAYWAADEYLRLTTDKQPMGGVDEMAYRLLDNAEDWGKALKLLSSAYDPETNPDAEAVERWKELAETFNAHHQA